MPNSTLDTIARRRSVRQFAETQLREEELQAILAAGRCAPSGGNNRTTHLIVVQNSGALEQLRALVEDAFSRMEVDETTYKSIRNSVADTACVLENMMIAATALHVGSCWINQLHWLDENEAVRAALYQLGLAEQETVCGGLALGYPAAEDALRPLEKDGNPVTYIR